MVLLFHNTVRLSSWIQTPLRYSTFYLYCTSNMCDISKLQLKIKSNLTENSILIYNIILVIPLSLPDFATIYYIHTVLTRYGTLVVYCIHTMLKTDQNITSDPASKRKFWLDKLSSMKKWMNINNKVISVLKLQC